VFAAFREKPYYDLLLSIEENLGDSKKEEVILKKEEIESEINYLRANLEIHNKKYYDLVLDIITSAVKRYQGAKRDYNMLDYNDLEDFAYEILKSGVNVNYKYILVDEFQDTNPTQVNILMKLTDSLSDRVNLFVVGDPKQSIYGFRGGDLESYRNFLEIMRDYGCEDLEMQENYRSQGTLIKSFNSIFKELLREDYKEIKANIFGEEKIKFLTWEEDEDTAVANYVQNLVESGVKDSEIAVLYRRKSYMQNLEKELLKRGLRVNNSSKRFSELAEIRDLMILLKATENSKDIISTLAFLKSPMVGMDEDSIFLAAYNYKLQESEGMGLGDGLDDVNYPLFEQGMKSLEYLRGLKKITNLGEFLSEAVIHLRYFEIARAVYGEDAKYNISKLIKMATDFDSIGSQSKYDFLTYLEKNDEDNHGSKGVNLMTIHKSKGLEFGHVILRDFNLPIRGGGNYDRFAVDDIGLGIKLEGRDAKYKIINEKEGKKSRAEEVRVLYVACTRAKETLTFSCEIDNSKGKKLLMKKGSFHEMIYKSGFTDMEILKGDERDLKTKQVFKIPDKGSLKNYKVIKTEIDNHLIRDEYIEKKSVLNYYSATSFITYKQNPKLFYDRYILGVKEEMQEDGNFHSQYSPIPFDIRGIILHKYAEIEPVDYSQFLSDQLRRHHLEENSETLNYLMNLMNIYDENKRGEILERELEFYFKEKGIYITGQIDQVRKVGD
ncbi:MAG: 3'-5' exonuclease, partial [Peptoniphilus sp.]|nr:3'-5' exonuclease [Peptoniphilus sp.]